MSEWDATSYEGKGTILRVVRDEADRLFEMAEQPGAWEAPTACESWQVRDIVGHLIDTTEGYFRAFDTARSGSETPAAYGLGGMHERAGEEAQSFHGLSQQETMERVRGDLGKMMGILEPLTAEEWSGLIVDCQSTNMNGTSRSAASPDIPCAWPPPWRMSQECTP